MRFLRFSLLSLFIFSCSQQEINHSSLFYFIPENSVIVLKVSNLENFNSSLTNNDFLNHLSKKITLKNLDKKLKTLSLLKPTNDLLICLTKNKFDSLEYSVITKYSKDLFVRDSLKNYSEELLNYNKKSLIKSTFNNQTFYSAIIDSTFFSSSSKELVEKAYTESNSDQALEKIYKATDDTKTVSMILKSANNNLITSLFPKSELNFEIFTKYISVDLDITQDKLLFNGITQAIDSSKSFVNVFKNTIPQENQTQNVTPANSDGYLSFTFNNFNNFHTNLVKFTQVDTLKTTSTLFDNIIEVGVIYNTDDEAIILNSLDTASTEEALIGEQNSLETYRQISIFNFSQPELFKNSFSPLITFNKATKYCVLDNFFVFADNLELLKNIISEYQNKTTLGNQSYFNSLKEELSDASSLLIVLNPNLLNSVINKSLNETTSLSIDSYKASALQFIYETNYAHVNGIIKKTRIKADQNAITEELNIKLEHDLLNNPHFVINHLNKQKEIVVQDIKNHLYLISNSGKVLWKRQLDGPVLGTIEQIDLYKNGRLQLIFATPHKVYVIDRNGKDVAPFPGNFNDVITQPLSVFDYDRNKNYRLLVTQGSNLIMYDKNLKVVSGFRFKQDNNPIISQPKHFRISNKDYLVFKTNRKIHLLDRTGQSRLNAKTSSTFSKEAIYLYHDKFTTTSLEGHLITIDSRGHSASQNLNLSETHHIETSSKTLVTLSENKLTIKGNVYELDYGIYTKPVLFYIQDKIYVTVTDLQTQKIYLFDSNAELLPNFPVYGNSSASLDNIDSDNDLEFVTKGDNNSIILYQIN